MKLKLSMKKKSHEIDMTQGPILKTMLAVAIPLMVTGVLQLLFNAADSAVLGKFAGADALAAVGSTMAVVSMLINTFIAITTGANVLAGQYFGKKDAEGMQKCVHSAMAFSLYLGIGVGLLSFFVCGPMLDVMGTDRDVLADATLYMKIYSLGVPTSIVYNFGAAILRAVGDTERPMRYLMLAGVVNLILNLITVIIFDMGVVGVALATVASQVLSAVLVVRCMMRTEGLSKLELKKAFKMEKEMVTQIIKIGVPAGLQAFIMSISHVLLATGYNSLGKEVVAGNSAASNIDSFIYLGMTSINQTALSFTSQNVGAKNSARLKRVLSCSLITVVATGMILSSLAIVFGRPLLTLFIDKQDASFEAVMEAGMIRLLYTGIPYFTCGFMDVCTSFLRGMGKSVSPLIITILGVCVLRVVWVATIFQIEKFHTLPMLFLCYPISWLLTGIVQYVFAQFSFRKLQKQWKTQAV